MTQRGGAFGRPLWFCEYEIREYGGQRLFATAAGGLFARLRRLDS